MTYKKILPSSSHIKSFHLGLQPAPAWIAILGFIFLSAVCILAGAGSILRIIFPAGAFLVGVFLYQRYPILYLGFTWWLWFLSPWVRRLVDYQSGWVEPNPVLLAPYLATLVTIATFLRHFPKSYRQDGLPFVLSCTGVFYSFLIGLINSKYGVDSTVMSEAIGVDASVYTLNAVLTRTLDWLTPILLSFHLFVNWRYYPEYRQNIQRTFSWGVLLMGAYGIYQYMVAPEWDRFWLNNIAKHGIYTFGIPEPLGIRVFSTMNSSPPFANAMMAGLLILLTSQGSLKFIATPIGYLAFLLSLVRTAWGGWFLGLIIFSSSLKSRLQMRLLITIFVMGILVFPLTTMEPFSKVISARVQTLSNVQQDGSYQDRADNYDRALGIALFQPLGNGLGLPGVDSAIIDTLIAMGWLGCIPYIGGIILLLFKLPQCVERRFDSFVSAAIAISLSSLAMLVSGNMFIGFEGILLWGFLGIVMAAHKYYQHQNILSRRVK